MFKREDTDSQCLSSLDGEEVGQCQETARDRGIPRGSLEITASSNSQTVKTRMRSSLKVSPLRLSFCTRPPSLSLDLFSPAVLPLLEAAQCVNDHYCGN